MEDRKRIFTTEIQRDKGEAAKNGCFDPFFSQAINRWATFDSHSGTSEVYDNGLPFLFAYIRWNGRTFAGHVFLSDDGGLARQECSKVESIG